MTRTSSSVEIDDVMDSSRRNGYACMGAIRLQCRVPHSAGDFEAATGDTIASLVRGLVSDVSAVIVTVGVKIGVGVTVAEMTTVVVTPGVAVITTVMVMVSGVGEGGGVGVNVGMGR
jgi:hypothetical protein